MTLTKDEILALEAQHMAGTITRDDAKRLYGALSGPVPRQAQGDFLNKDELYLFNYAVEGCTFIGRTDSGRDHHKCVSLAVADTLELLEDTVGRAAMMSAIGVFIKASMQHMLMVSFPGLTAAEAVALLEKEKAEYAAKKQASVDNPVSR